jgi:RNA polymerase sigma-70 factor (ECF subfamily)
MSEATCCLSFEEEVVPLLDAAYNLARWLTCNEHDAQDVVQEACIRAFRGFAQFRGGNVRAWLLTIVRNTSYNWLNQNRRLRSSVEFDEELFSTEYRLPNPEQALLQSASDQMVRSALEKLSYTYREVLVLRELEELSYREISRITGMPIGTVMSKLSRGREVLRQSLINLSPEGSQTDSRKHALASRAVATTK